MYVHVCECVRECVCMCKGLILSYISIIISFHCQYIISHFIASISLPIYYLISLPVYYNYLISLPIYYISFHCHYIISHFIASILNEKNLAKDLEESHVLKKFITPYLTMFIQF